MAFLGGEFDASQVNPESQFDPLPSGEYPAIIIDSEMKTTKSGSGQYLELVYQVLDGPCKGRQVWVRLNLVNDNAKTVEIAQQHLSGICHAVGKLKVSDSAELHNIPHVIRVEFLPAGGKRDRDGNEVRGWKKIEGAVSNASPFVPPASAQAARPTQPAAPVVPQAPAWAQKPAA